MYAKKNSGKKVVATLLAIILLIGCTIGATVAYLMAQTETVTNTFVIGDIGTLTLSENGKEITADTTESFTIIPGVDITKNVTVSYSHTATTDDADVPVYVFVKVNAPKWTVDSTNKTAYSVADGLLSWNIAGGWNYVTTEENAHVYCRTVSDNESLTNAPVIANDGVITVSADITKANISSVAGSADDISFTAYAIQQAKGANKFTPEEAWNELS